MGPPGPVQDTAGQLGTAALGVARPRLMVASQRRKEKGKLCN